MTNVERDFEQPYKKKKMKILLFKKLLIVHSGKRLERHIIYQQRQLFAMIDLTANRYENDLK